jgi:hypothetical protein
MTRREEKEDERGDDAMQPAIPGAALHSSRISNRNTLPIRRASKSLETNESGPF